MTVYLLSVVFFFTCHHRACRSYDSPKMVEGLQGKHVRDIACGSGHSAAITSNGELYTWGQGDHGRLGHGDSLNQSKPKQVNWELEQNTSLLPGCIHVYSVF